MKSHKVIFSSDLHGNLKQYELLIDYSIENAIDSIIIGGDIGPADEFLRSYIETQKIFFETKLPELFSRLKTKLPKAKVYIMMGNDDCKAHMDILEKYDMNYNNSMDNSNSYFHLIHNQRLKLNDDFDIVGYSCVPITPFGIKDWEKFDLSQVPEALIKQYDRRKLINYRYQGYISTKKTWKSFLFRDEIEKTDSIQTDLTNELFTQNPGKTVYVIHTPPDNTNLDITSRSTHVGSFAVRQFIENQQPYLTLHGHIHETVEMSGSYQDQIGKTLCMTAGNNCNDSHLAIIKFDFYDLKNSERIIIDKNRR